MIKNNPLPQNNYGSIKLGLGIMVFLLVGMATGSAGLLTYASRNKPLELVEIWGSYLASMCLLACFSKCYLSINKASSARIFKEEMAQWREQERLLNPSTDVDLEGQTVRI